MIVKECKVRRKKCQPFRQKPGTPLGRRGLSKKHHDTSRNFGQAAVGVDEVEVEVSEDAPEEEAADEDMGDEEAPPDPEADADAEPEEDMGDPEEPAAEEDEDMD